jgi:hypothetical protein
MEGFLFSGFEASANSVIRVTHLNAQPTKLLFNL